MQNTWPHELIRELLARAEAVGRAEASLNSPREAELFRFAIYNFRRTVGIGQSLTVTLDDAKVIVTSSPAPVVILSEESAVNS